MGPHHLAASQAVPLRNVMDLLQAQVATLRDEKNDKGERIILQESIDNLECVCVCVCVCVLYALINHKRNELKFGGCTWLLWFLTTPRVGCAREGFSAYKNMKSQGVRKGGDANSLCKCMHIMWRVYYKSQQFTAL